jgi:transcription initiation factor TFIIIB Brf1 subunit/transcription initiation factor TFIIB
MVGLYTPPINPLKHFKAKNYKGRKIVCKHCGIEIDPAPYKGINGRRINHLEGCKKYLATAAMLVNTGDYHQIINAIKEHDDQPDKLITILPFM